MAARLKRHPSENVRVEWMEKYSDPRDLVAKLKREEAERQARARRLARLADPGGRLVR
jgi:hypothetical protein